MRFPQTLTYVALSFAVLFFKNAPAMAATDVEFIIDVSGSMTQKLGGESQINLARKALSNALNELKADQMVAVRAYGHRVDQKNKEESCKDSELIVPFQKLNRQAIETAVAKLTPKGYTPIAYSLQETKNDLLDVGMARETERVIILLTDGEETCGGNAVEVLNQLKAEGFKVKVLAIGFNVNDVARKELKEIADVSGGKYFDAKDGAQLSSALKEASRQAAVVIEKTEATYGEAIRGGDSYESAVPVPLGKELKLDHHQKSSAFDYFVLEAKAGDQISIACSTLLKGVDLRDPKAVQSNLNPYCGVQLHSSDRQMVKYVDGLGQSKKVTETYVVPAAGKYFVLVGSNYGSVPQDGALFTITTETHGDLDSTQDAGDTMESALPLTPKRYSKNYLCEGDNIDMYKFTAKAGETYMFGVIPNSKESGSVSIRVYDDFKRTVTDGFMSSNSGFKSENFTIKEDGDYYLELGCSSGKFFEYTLLWKQQPAAAAPAAPVAEGTPIVEATPEAAPAM